MIEVGIVEARRTLSELAERAALGEEIVVTRFGKPVARIVACDASEFDVRPPEKAEAFGAE